MNRKHSLGVSVFVLLFVLACGDPAPWRLLARCSHMSGSVDASATQTATTLPVHNVGDVIEVAGRTIVLTSAELKDGKIAARFWVENYGPEELAVSWLFDFDAKDRFGIPLLITVCGAAEPVESVVPGGGYRGGLICWEADAGMKGMRITYEPSESSGEIIVWEPFE
jgi:hypothetical protein